MQITISGAGLAGLLAANILRRHSPLVIDRQPSLPDNHHALLRFRSEAVSNATAIPFTRYLVRKGAWDGERVRNDVTIPLANIYARNVLAGSGVSDRSVWNLGPEHRWLAPADFAQQMAQGADVQMDTPFSVIDHGRGSNARPVISTLPMPILMGLLKYPSVPAFCYNEITTTRCLIQAPEVSVHQTVYNCSQDSSWYRATLHGPKVIIEGQGDRPISRGKIEEMLALCFGISHTVFFNNPTYHVQKFGKILPIPDQERKAFILWASREFNIHSLGRFATWRPLLLDDLVHDVEVIERIITGSSYEQTLQHTKQ